MICRLSARIADKKERQCAQGKELRALGYSRDKPGFHGFGQKVTRGECDVHHLRKDASVNRFSWTEASRGLRLSSRPSKVLGFQWCRDETNPAGCWAEGRKLERERRRSGCGHQNAVLREGSLILIITLLPAIINGGVASRATGRENEPTKRLRRQPLPKRVFLLAGPQRVHELPRPQLRRCFQLRQPCW